MFTISGFYKFKKINFLKKYKTYLENEISNTSIKGSIIISSEGINGSLAGNSKDIHEDAEYLAKRMFHDEYKIDAHMDKNWTIQVEDDLDEVSNEA